MDSYQTIESVEHIISKDKGSKFYGFAYTVRNEAEVREKLEAVRKIHPKATHHCYAYRLGIDNNNFRANDDGEPNGTAGKPILGQIDSFGVTNCLIIIVRYFGGTKLGVGGLITAYKEAAQITLTAAKKIENRILDYYTVRCDYDAIKLVYQLIHQLPAKITEQSLDNKTTFIISIEQNLSNTFETALRNAQLDYTFLERK
jgi:uncharacterized YigZ family protein